MTPPATLSDWMPYAGLWYLRRSWEPDATFIHMLAQPKGHPSTNGSDWNTEVHLFDYGQPLLACSPVWIDGQPPFNEAGTRTFKPGSKTETLAVASEHPIPARWHTSAFCDYAESFYEGTYQRHQAQFDRQFRSSDAQLLLGDTKAEDTRADRRVILLRPARLAIITDAVRVPLKLRRSTGSSRIRENSETAEVAGPRETPPNSHEFGYMRVPPSGKPRTFEVRQRFAIPETDAPRKRGDEQGVPGKFEGDARSLTLKNENLPGVAVHRFTTAKLTWDPRKTPDAWDGAALANHLGGMEHLGGILRAEPNGNLLMSALIEPQQHPGASIVKSTRDLSRDGITGFLATLTDGTALTWLATHGETDTLNTDTITLAGDGLLVWKNNDDINGLALGAKSLRIAGQAIALTATDFEFALRNGGLTGTTPIHRPIEPVTFSPDTTVFTDNATVSLTSATPGVEIRYTLDGTEPNARSPLYAAPLRIDRDAFIRARAFRPGVKTIPFATAGTDATVVSEARYHRRALKPATAPARPAPGLRWELVEGNWSALFTHLNLPAVMPAKASGETTELLDVSMRQADGPFGVRYNGFLEVPADGVWTFHAPREYVGATCEPGYDLRVWIDGEEWYLGQRFQGEGQWSVPLAKGAHRLLVTFADARHRDGTVYNPGLWRGYPSPWVVWKGEAPVIRVSGPGTDKQPIPSAWLKHPGPIADRSGSD